MFGVNFTRPIEEILFNETLAKTTQIILYEDDNWDGFVFPFLSRKVIDKYFCMNRFKISYTRL